MRQDMANVGPLTVVKNDDNKAILVSGNIEHDEFANLVRASEELSHIRKILPTGILNRFDPMPQPRFCIGMFCPELLQRPTGYQTHCLYFRKLRNRESIGYFRNMRKATHPTPFGALRDRSVFATAPSAA
jgi:hypothetical protein